MPGGMPTGGIDGLQSIYSKYLTASQYVSSVPWTRKTAWIFGEQLNGLKLMLSFYVDDVFLNEYENVRKLVDECDKAYDDEDYLNKIHYAMTKWFMSLSTLMARLGLILPEDLYVTTEINPTGGNE